jgi:hypothetical protein
MPSTYVGRLPQGELECACGCDSDAFFYTGVTKADLEDVGFRLPSELIHPQHFKTIGRVVDIRLMANFGFVEFETAEVLTTCPGQSADEDRMLRPPAASLMARL